jgi:hypothetical protein
MRQAANLYSNLNYRIGMTKGKELVLDHYTRYIDNESWDRISIILDGMVCVDLDRFVSLGNEFALPETLKERSPRGLHFFYRLPHGFKGSSKIGWKKNVDLLTLDSVNLIYRNPNKMWQGHVLCSPSKGYSRLYPKAMPEKSQLPVAPDWILDALAGK